MLLVKEERILTIFLPRILAHLSALWSRLWRKGASKEPAQVRAFSAAALRPRPRGGGLTSPRRLRAPPSSFGSLSGSGSESDAGSPPCHVASMILSGCHWAAASLLKGGRHWPRRATPGPASAGGRNPSPGLGPRTRVTPPAAGHGLPRRRLGVSDSPAIQRLTPNSNLHWR
jgi:hypothetical protein